MFSLNFWIAVLTFFTFINCFKKDVDLSLIQVAEVNFLCDDGEWSFLSLNWVFLIPSRRVFVVLLLFFFGPLKNQFNSNICQKKLLKSLFISCKEDNASSPMSLNLPQSSRLLPISWRWLISLGMSSFGPEKWFSIIFFCFLGV